MEEGITESGATSCWLAAATAYANHDCPLIPFYVFYSMFGFQRIGDLCWAAGDLQARGFLLGATSGRTTLNGEGLQHQDGHSHVLSSTVPNCVSYDPTYAYELAVIIQHGLEEMYVKKRPLFYYVTIMNENYSQPPMPEGCEEDIIKGMYLLRPHKGRKSKKMVQLMGSGTILREVIAAADILESQFGITADIWSVTSFTELRREGMTVSRWNMLHPDETPRTSHIEDCFADKSGPVIAATDYMKTFADQIREFIDASYTVLGTDGFGRSDTREQLRSFFEVDRRYIAVAALSALVKENVIDANVVKKAIVDFEIDPEKPDPAYS